MSLTRTFWAANASVLTGVTVAVAPHLDKLEVLARSSWGKVAYRLLLG